MFEEPTPTNSIRVTPNVRAMLEILSHDSDISMNFKAKVLTYADAAELEELAQRIRGEERTTFVIGEESEQQAVCRKYSAHKLHEFINHVFEGEYPELTPTPRPYRMKGKQW